MKYKFKEEAIRLLAVIAASVILAVNIKSFVRTGGLYPGGVTGLSLLIQRFVSMNFDVTLPYTLINILLNAVPVYIGFRFLGLKFTLYSCLNIVLTSILTDIIPGYEITYDVLLLSVFGGLIYGFAISLCLMVNTTSGGTDIIAIFLSNKKGIDSWNIILVFNVLIIGVAGLMFGWDIALYSIIFQFTSTQVLHALHRKYQQHTLFVVTNNAKEVCDVIYSSSHHGATVIEGEGSYENNERKIVYSVVSSAESKVVTRAVREADPEAFVNVIKTEQVSGKFYLKPYE